MAETNPPAGQTRDGDVSAEADVIELTPSEQVRLDPDGIDADFLDADEFEADQSVDSEERVELIKDGSPEVDSETALLMHRLRAVTIFLLIGLSIALIAALTGESVRLFGGYEAYVEIGIARVLLLAVILGVLLWRPTRTPEFLRGVEYVLFGAIGLLWVYARYRAIVANAQTGDVADLLVDSREALIGLLLIMFIQALFIPHNWQGTARVVLTLALAPTLAVALVQVMHPELTSQLTAILTPRNVIRELLILGFGAFLAICGSQVLSTLRSDVRHARQFGQYHLLQLLGQGGMGEVYLAEHSLLKRACALKLIRTDEAEEPTALARFEREVQSTARLTHPNTVEVYDYGHTDDDTFYYVMEFLPGMSLQELLELNEPLPPGRIIYLLRQVCSALAEAHDAGMVHRDLKPANILITERGGLCDFVKVLDFGLVKLTSEPGADALTADHIVSGTPRYMAPEQASGERGLDGRCDQYALGTIAYHMATGKLPFAGSSAVAIMIAHASEDVVPPSQICPGIPKDLEQVILRCMQKKPADRFEDILAVDKALAACSSAGDWDAQQAAVWWHEALFHRPAAEALQEEPQTSEAM